MVKYSFDLGDVFKGLGILVLLILIVRSYLLCGSGGWGRSADFLLVASINRCYGAAVSPPPPTMARYAADVVW